MVGAFPSSVTWVKVRLTLAQIKSLFSSSPFSLSHWLIWILHLSAIPLAPCQETNCAVSQGKKACPPSPGLDWMVLMGSGRKAWLVAFSFPEGSWGRHTGAGFSSSLMVGRLCFPGVSFQRAHGGHPHDACTGWDELVGELHCANETRKVQHRVKIHYESPVFRTKGRKTPTHATI